MAECIRHELNSQFNEMDEKSKNKRGTTKKKSNKKKNYSKNVKSEMCNTEAQSMPYHTLTNSQDITYICSLCGSNLYSDIIQEDAAKGTLYFKLNCPRGCVEPPADHFDGAQLQPMEVAEYSINYQQHPMPTIHGNFHNFNMPMNDGYITCYNPYLQHNMPTMPNNDYRFHSTTDLRNARATRLNQLLKSVNCEHCYPMTVKEKTNRFEKFKRKNVRRAEYQLSSAQNYSGDAANSTPDFNPDLSSMAEGMFEYSERIRRFYEHAQYHQGCEKCGDTQ